MTEKEGYKRAVRTALAIAGFVVFASAGGLYGCPKYNVWQQNLVGEAELARASQNRQIKIQEAQAAKDAARFLADAEVARAEGVRQANKIIAEGLGGPDGYLRYLWIHALEEGKNLQVIYVPTETNLPILEAARGFGKPGVEPTK